MGDALRRYLTVREIMAGTGLSYAAVTKRAHDRQWRRLNSRPQKYLLEDVLRAEPPTRRDAIRSHLLAKYWRGP